MYYYKAYNLLISSEFFIPEFPTVDGNCDVDLVIEIDQEFAPNNYLPDHLLDKEIAAKISPQESVVYWKNKGVFIIQNGSRIIMHLAPNVSEQVIRLFLNGNIMAIILYQRGFLVLHASVVNVGDRAVAFLGESGEGKSSTAAAFCAAGYSLVADDVAAIDLRSSTFKIIPGFPQLKIAPQIADSLQLESGSLHTLHESLGKLGFRPKQDFSQTPLPIQGIYVLKKQAEFGIAPLRPEQALMELARHSRIQLLFQFDTQHHWSQCTKLIKQQSLHYFYRPIDLKLLPQLVKTLEAETCFPL